MYKCVHCQKEKRDCRCQTPFRTPDTPHDLPGQKRILRLLFDVPAADWEKFDEYMTAMKVSVSMSLMIDRALFEGDRKPLRGPWRSHNADAAKAKRDAFFSSSQFSRPYYRTKHGGNDE